MKKKCPYRQALDKQLHKLDQAHAQLQVAQEERQLIEERANVLCDLIATQACVQEQLQKHWSWLYGMAPEQVQQQEQEDSPSAADEAQLLHQNQYRQHTCVRLVEAATPQLLQQVLSMTTEDWVCLCRCHFRELAVLLEFVNRPPQMYRDDPVAFEAAASVAACLAAQTDAAAAGQPAPGTPAASVAAAAAAAGVDAAVLTGERLQQMTSAAPPFELQQPTSSMSGSAGEASCATEAAAAAALSSEDDLALPWERDPIRLLVEALCRQGVKFHAALLHQSMALLSAGSMNLETMQHEQPSPHFWRRAVDRLHLSPSQMVHFKVALQEYRRLTRAATAAGLDLVQHTKEFSLSAAAAKYAKQGEPAAAAAAAASAAAAEPLPAVPAAAAAAADGSSAAQLDARLQRHWNSFFTNMYLVNTFCTNVLTPYQHAVMWTTSYPYMPVLGAMAEALEALPPSGCMPLPPHVQARIDANIEQHTALRSTVIAQQRKELCWWEARSRRV
ncbi:hypothetical protein OEZ85_011739 [Tetradesmus obliquus]|uniref:Uncharacterized protein n=1 Tax=Tetradesmus obliquus TaxID=3088 RepID=A0ABY8TR81_TETOB|nr:hypothetical protein OEZ85_011739 [Tetradesmus obliquus]